VMGVRLVSLCFLFMASTAGIVSSEAIAGGRLLDRAGRSDLVLCLSHARERRSQRENDEERSQREF